MSLVFMKEPSNEPSKLLCVGAVLSAHGLRGLLKVQSFMQNPADLFRCEVLYDAKGTFLLSFASKEGEADFHPPTSKGVVKGYPCFLARPLGCTDRTKAETFVKKKLYAPRGALPRQQDKEEGTQNLFYHDDLKGLWALDKAGCVRGRVLGVHNFKAGDLLNIRLLKTPCDLEDIKTAKKLLWGADIFVRFHHSHVQKVELQKGFVLLTEQAFCDAL